MIDSCFFTHVRLLRFYMWRREIHSSSSTSRLLPWKYIRWLKLIIKMFKIGFCLSKYVIEVVFLNMRLCFDSQNIKFSLVSLQPRPSGMHSYVLSNRQKHFLICLLCCNVDFSELSLHLNYRCKSSSLLYNAKNLQPQFIFWTWFLFMPGFSNVRYRFYSDIDRLTVVLALHERKIAHPFDKCLLT